LLLNFLPGDGILIVPHDTFGLDLSPGLSVKLDSPYLPDIVDIGEVSGNSIKAVRQEYSGMVSTHVECDMSNGLVMNLRGGSFAPVENGSKNGEVADKTDDALGGDLPEVKRKFIEVIEAEVGEVDITKSDVLVSVGRGIEDQDNLDMVFELAEAMGADVSCSRPIVDSKWMEKSRQVGTSGQTVKPKVYLALGISGAFQHIGGIKGSPFIVAINKNPKAPIFQSADIGIVADILDFIPDFTEKIEEIKG
jgi:electron transfer flavoprotein alpha subunit